MINVSINDGSSKLIFEWIGTWKDELKNVWMNEWIKGLMKEWMKGWMKECINEYMKGWENKWMNNYLKMKSVRIPLYLLRLRVEDSPLPRAKVSKPWFSSDLDQISSSYNIPDTKPNFETFPP